jgi:DNA-binding NarL/FixJ family response regulator
VTCSTPSAHQAGETKPAASYGRLASAAVAAPEARDELTAQELQISQLAAQGLSNREIGQMLFLSHTVR